MPGPMRIAGLSLLMILSPAGVILAPHPKSGRGGWPQHWVPQGVLRADGLPFVVAPMPTVDGGILQLVEGRWAVALYPFLAGDSPQWGAYPTTAEGGAGGERRAALQQKGGWARVNSPPEGVATPLASTIGSSGMTALRAPQPIIPSSWC